MPLTVQPGPAAVALKEEASGFEGNPLGLGHFVQVEFAVRAQEESVVDLLGGGGVVQPLLQPLQRDELVRLPCGGRTEPRSNGTAGSPRGGGQQQGSEAKCFPRLRYQSKVWTHWL